jgi:hypothetical protein
MAFAVRDTLEACVADGHAAASVRAVECAVNLGALHDADAAGGLGLGRQYALYLYDTLPPATQQLVDPAIVAVLTNTNTAAAHGQHWVGIAKPPLAVHVLGAARRAYTAPLPPRDAMCMRLTVVTDGDASAYDPQHICRHVGPVGSKAGARVAAVDGPGRQHVVVVGCDVAGPVADWWTAQLEAAGHNVVALECNHSLTGGPASGPTPAYRIALSGANDVPGTTQ